MIYACFSPSLFACDDNIDTVRGIADEVGKWISDLKSVGVEKFFTDEYVAEILSHKWPWHDSEASRYLREIQLIISTKAHSPIHAEESFCNCDCSSSAWNDVLFTACQNSSVGIISRCGKYNIGEIPICRDKEAFAKLRFPPWICKIDAAHKDKIPLSGDFFYSPPRNWQSSNLKHYWPDIDKDGYLDENNNLWVWQNEEGGHWDVTPQKGNQYTRVGIKGNVIDKKYRR